MRKSIRRILLILCVLVLAASAAGADVFIEAEKPEDWEQRDLLRITAMGYSQNDGFVLEYGGEVMLIDGGSKPRWKELAECLQGREISHVNILFNTHPHDDHIEAQTMLLKNDVITADVFISPFAEDYDKRNKTGYQQQMVSTLKAKGIPYRQMFPEEELTLGGKVRMVMFRADTGDANAMSAVLRLEFGETSMLFTGDVGGTAQKEILSKYGAERLKCDILKSPHHGIMRVVPAFLEAADPLFVVITSTKKAPMKEQLDYRKIPNLCTSKGNMTLETDGKDWYITQENKWAQ